MEAYLKFIAVLEMIVFFGIIISIEAQLIANWVVYGNIYRKKQVD